MPKTTGNAGASKRGTSKQPAATVGPVVPSTEPNDSFSNFDPKTTFWNPQNARALVYASDLAYKEDPAFIKANANNWGFAEDRVSIIDVSDLRALIMGSDKAVVVAFRGTRPSELIDWMVDFEILQVPFTKYFAARMSAVSMTALHAWLLGAGGPFKRKSFGAKIRVRLCG
jgi:hypothetical protein